MVAIVPAPFQTYFRLTDGQALDTSLAFPTWASEDSITAHSGGGQSAAYQLTAPMSRITTSAAGTDSVQMPKSFAGKFKYIINDGANAIQVFGNAVAADTINGIATGTGISQPANTIYMYTCTTGGNWITKNITEAFTNLSVNTKLTYTGARVGTFVNNNATPVTVANTLVTAASMIVVTLNTPGGTVGTVPAVQTITAGTGFTVKGAASDTSTYNYMLIESA